MYRKTPHGTVKHMAAQHEKKVRAIPEFQLGAVGEVVLAEMPQQSQPIVRVKRKTASAHSSGACSGVGRLESSALIHR